MDLIKIKNIAIQEFKHDINSLHGIQHWNEVYENGLILGKQQFVDLPVVIAFAFLHDCKRTSDAPCVAHGPEAAQFIETLTPSDLELNPTQHQVLIQACKGHTLGTITDHPTIGACWDADRLDLLRIGITPHESLMSTEFGKILARKLTKYHK